MTREEAIRRIKAWNLDSDDREVLAVVIPELTKWSEKDSLHLVNAILSAEKEWGTESCTAKWLKSLPERFNLSPKPTWSEEDEERLKAICTYLQDYPRLAKINDVKRFNEYCDWLKSLRPQPKAELTLLDKNIIEAAVAFVEQNDHFNCWGGIDKHTVIKALRSLKPHWKPSEEQMEAFKKYIEEFQARAEAAVGGWNNFDVMIRLYEQFKKL